MFWCVRPILSGRTKSGGSRSERIQALDNVRFSCIARVLAERTGGAAEAQIVNMRGKRRVRDDTVVILEDMAQKIEQFRL